MHSALTSGTIGVALLWIAALLTIVTGYDYMRAGLRHMSEADGSLAGRAARRDVRSGT